MLGRIIDTLRRQKGESLLSYANDHNERPNEGRGPIDDFHSMTEFVREAGPFGLKVLKFISNRVDKWEEQGGIQITVFGFPLIRINL